jgi:DNA-binding phage protein
MRRFFVSGFEVSETKEPSTACAKVMTQVARDGRASRENLYKALSGNRSLIMKALGAFSLHAKAVKT